MMGPVEIWVDTPRGTSDQLEVSILEATGILPKLDHGRSASPRAEFDGGAPGEARLGATMGRSQVSRKRICLI